MRTAEMGENHVKWRAVKDKGFQNIPIRKFINDKKLEFEKKSVYCLNQIVDLWLQIVILFTSLFDFYEQAPQEVSQFTIENIADHEKEVVIFLLTLLFPSHTLSFNPKPL